MRVLRRAITGILLASLLLPFRLPAFAASSWTPALLVNTEAFQVIDDSDPAANVRLTFGSGINRSLTYERSTTRFRFDDDLSVQGNLSGSSLRIDGYVDIWGSLSASGSAKIDGTISGSGNVMLEGNLTGSTITGFGLPGAGCTGASNKLVWNAATSKFECAADQTGGGAAGIVDHYVRASGDSMTGGLMITNGNPAATIGNGLLLEVAGTASGDHLHAHKTLTSSGELVTEGRATFNGVAVFNEDSAAASNVRMEGDNEQNLFFLDAASDRIGLGTSAPDVRFDVVGTVSGTTLTFMGGTSYILGTLGIGTTTTDANVKLEVVGVISGTTINTSNGINASGSIITEQGFSGATLAGIGLVDCDTGASSKLLYDLTTKKFSCGTDQGGSGGGMSLTRVNGSSGAAGADLTWQNLTSNSANCTTTALCAAAITTTGVGVGTWKYKYTLIYQTAATTTGIGFGLDHTGTVGQIQHMWYHLTTGGAAATGIGDNDTATAAGQLVEGKHEGVDNTLIGSATAGVAVANADITAIIEGIVVVTASGDLQLKLASEVAGSAVRIMADSTLELMKIE